MATTTLTIPQPDDFHAHLRQLPELAQYVADYGAVFGRVLVMPNTLPAVRSAIDVNRYRAEILAADAAFSPLMTFRVDAALDTAAVRDLAAAGAVAGKYYPAGVTTNSSDGVADVRSVYPVIEAMQSADLVLSIHGEHPTAFCLDREAAFLPILGDIVADFPRLRVVLEHISTAVAAEAVAQFPDRVAATITPHHLSANLHDLLGDHLRPHLFCKPLLKRPEDQRALIAAATGGSPKYFLGSDSAPHLRHAKEADCGCAGVYTAPIIMPMVAAVFDAADRLLSLAAFCSRSGADFYRLPTNLRTIQLVRRDTVVPTEYHGVVPFGAGGRIPWSVVVEASAP